METNIKNYKGYVIYTEESWQRGIFFRNPLQNVFFDAYESCLPFDAYKYVEAIKNPIRRVYEILIGNGRVIKKAPEWADDMCFAGFKANILCFPIYFYRKYRKLETIYCGKERNNILQIKSYGYESKFNFCSGGCAVEKTKINLSNGK